jgi:hypothetical protein
MAFINISSQPVIPAQAAIQTMKKFFAARRQNLKGVLNKTAGFRPAPE